MVVADEDQVASIQGGGWIIVRNGGRRLMRAEYGKREDEVHRVVLGQEEKAVALVGGLQRRSCSSEEARAALSHEKKE